MAKILIIYSSTDGHTKEICSHLQQIAEDQNNQVTLLSVNYKNSITINSFDKIVIGASIRYGKHSKKIYEFIKDNEQILNSKSNAFFSVNVVARKQAKSKPETNPYLQKFLKSISWEPRHLAVFAGKIEYQKYRFWDRLMIRFIMWITKGPTDPKANIEYTNWSDVGLFGQTICDM